VERSDLPYLLLGATAAGRRRSRGAVAFGVRAAGIALLPPVAVWRSPIAAPRRRRASDASAALSVSGRDTAGRVRSSAEVAAGYRARRVGEQVLRSGLLEEVVDRLLSRGAFDHVVAIVINHSATERMISSAFDDPGVDRLVAGILDSRMIDEVTTRLLDSDEMRLVLDHVTRSPELRAALAQQTAGLAGDMAEGVRSRTVVADAAAERFARSLLRRRPRTSGS
jgi:hypothetical protein